MHLAISYGPTSLVATALLAAITSQETVGPPANLAAVFNTGANLGFSVIRAAYSVAGRRHRHRHGGVGEIVRPD